MKPIQSEKERKEVFESVINTVMRVEGVDREQAIKRYNALMKSGLLDEIGASPDNPYTQRRIDEIMATHID